MPASTQDPAVSLFSLSGPLSLACGGTGQSGCEPTRVSQVSWDSAVVPPPGPYQQLAAVLELGLVQHPPVAQILQLLRGPPRRPEAKQVLEEMLTFRYPSLQFLWGKGNVPCTFQRAQKAPPGSREELIKFHCRGADGRY